MIAKLIAHDDTRAGAIARMREALAATRLAGVSSNLGFVEALLRSPAVTDRIPDTGTIDRMPKSAFPGVPPWLAAAPHVAAAWVLRGSRADDPALPASAWSALTHWRLGAAQGYQPLQPQFEVQVHAGPMSATVGTLPGQRYRVQHRRARARDRLRAGRSARRAAGRDRRQMVPCGSAATATGSGSVTAATPRRCRCARRCRPPAPPLPAPGRRWSRR